jgi:hypothetical protein
MSSSSTLETASPPEELQHKSEDQAAAEKWTIVEFEGDDDRWDPKNFSKVKKWLCLASVTHGAVVVTCASSLYVPLKLAFVLIGRRWRVISRSRRSFRLLRLWRFWDFRCLSLLWHLGLVWSQLELANGSIFRAVVRILREETSLYRRLYLFYKFSP